MTFALFRCRDRSFVIVPHGLTPPIQAIRVHGDATLVSDRPRQLYESAAWDDISRRMDAALFVKVQPKVAQALFEIDALRNLPVARPLSDPAFIDGSKAQVSVAMPPDASPHPGVGED